MRDTSTTTEPTAAGKLAFFQSALEAKIERLGVQSGDVVVVRPAGEAQRDWSSAMTESLSTYLGKHLGGGEGLLLLIPPGADIEVLDETMMEKHGWVRTTSHIQENE